MKKVCLMLSVALSGCSTYSETFDCPAGQGVGCKSLSKVNQMVEKGELPHKDPDDVISSDIIKARPVKTDQAAPVHLNADIMYASSKFNRIWFAGHKDIHGNYHEAHFVEPASLKG